MVKERKEINRLLVKVGVAFALSFSGFLFSWLRTKSTKPSQPTRSEHVSDRDCEVDPGGDRTFLKDDLQITKKSPSSGTCTPIPADRGEDSYVVKVAVSPSKHGGDQDGYLLPEFNELVKEFDFTAASAGKSPKKNAEPPASDLEASKAFAVLERNEYEQEIRHLQNMVKALRERERGLEVQLLEFYGIKEQEATVMELQNRLKINNMEAKFLALRIESLQADNQRLQEQVSDHANLVSELDAARAKIKLLKKLLRSEAEQNREQILALQKRVTRMHEQELKAGVTDLEIKSRLQMLNDLEKEAGELRMSNSRLCKENSELASQLESTQILANSALEDSATKALRGLCDRLRQENENLAKEIEQLQADRCNDVEELVYVRWVNACLRYELRNYQPTDGKTVARDLSKSLSPKSEEKAKKLILEYANLDKGANIMDADSDHWSFSQGSYVADSAYFDESPPQSKTENSRKASIFKKLRRLIRGKGIHHGDHGSAVEKTGGVQDSDSLFLGSASIMTDSVSDVHSNRAQTPSPYPCPSKYLSRHSLDIQRSGSPKMNDIKHMESCQNYSDAGSSYGYPRLSSGGGSTSDSSFENLLNQASCSSEKSDLVKFAEVLNDSGSFSSRTANEDSKGKVHRKAVSLGSFPAIPRSKLE